MWMCGTGRRSINPELGHQLAGYGVGYANTGVHDDLSVTAMYVSDGTGEAVLLVLDLIGLMPELELTIREAAAAACGVPAERVALTCTHTHRGPETRAFHYRSGPTQGMQPAYNARLAAWAAEAAADARAAAVPCVLRHNWTQAEENLNRRFLFPDRRLLGIPENKHLAGLSTGFVDRELGVLAFQQEGTRNKYAALLTNYAAHPLCVGNASDLATADYPGVLRQTVEETFAGCRCLATTGACGDLHPLRPESGFAEARRMGEALGTLAIKHAYNAAATAPEETLRFTRRRIALTLKDADTRRLFPTRAEQERIPWIVREGRTVLETDFYLLGLGPILLVGVPGELSAELGASLKHSSPFLKTYPLYLATDFADYLLPASHYYWGGYTPGSAIVAAGAGEALVAAILDAAWDLVRAQPLRLTAVG